MQPNVLHLFFLVIVTSLLNYCWTTRKHTKSTWLGPVHRTRCQQKEWGCVRGWRSRSTPVRYLDLNGLTRWFAHKEWRSIWLIMIIKLLKNNNYCQFFPFVVESYSHFVASLLHKPSCCVDHIYTNFVMYLGEEDLPDPLDARCSSWMGLGERCSTLYEMGHTYRYRVIKAQFLFFYITALKSLFTNYILWSRPGGLFSR